ncbi:MAG: hypothetical protein IT210_11290 [Armatimonadetes bacterium]|nr:hypothetical protein [Armatimonadota bacterium]
MTLTLCRECRQEVSMRAFACPHCGAPYPAREEWNGWGVDWRSEMTLMGWPLVHVAIGRDAQGRLRVAKGIIAIGQFGIGVITIAQFGVGLLFGFGQFMCGLTALAQVAVAGLFGVGQFATGYIAIGQLAFGQYVVGQLGIGEYVWSTQRHDPQALDYLRGLAGRVGIHWGR